ncbi:MAG: phage integrase SAM-like domain-containing protein [Oscillospiraceae bacterium]|nr:phage integrase SAM-like domain-containing protein [Oscillospiraceae bacterium]
MNLSFDILILLTDWLNSHTFNIDITKYNSYKCIIDAQIITYFRNKKIYLQDITPLDIQNYYSSKSNQGLSNNSILKHHANIRKSVDYAYILDIIWYNHADKVIKPKKEKYNANFLDESNFGKGEMILMGTSSNNLHLKLSVSPEDLTLFSGGI